MLTIGQLAAYAGVTVRAVRHYHAKGLLPEPERDHSGYRSYDAAHVLALIKIRTLAEAGVPLARVAELLEADEEEFGNAVAEIDARLREEIRERQEHRRRIRELVAGDRLALPAEVADYLERLRADGATEEMLGPERDLWILVAARWPEQVPQMIADKVARLDHPQVARLMELVTRLSHEWQEGGSAASQATLTELADLIVALFEEADARGELGGWDDPDARYAELMDTFARSAHPAVAELQELVAARGWDGWSFAERRR